MQANCLKRGLHVLPDKFKTRDICEFAFKEDPWLFDCLPERFKTQEMCEQAVKKDPSCLMSLKTREMCEEAASKNAWSLIYIFLLSSLPRRCAPKLCLNFLGF